MTLLCPARRRASCDGSQEALPTNSPAGGSLRPKTTNGIEALVPSSCVDAAIAKQALNPFEIALSIRATRMKPVRPWTTWARGVARRHPVFAARVA